MIKKHFFQSALTVLIDKLFEPFIHERDFLAFTNGAVGRLPMPGSNVRKMVAQ